MDTSYSHWLDGQMTQYPVETSNKWHTSRDTNTRETGTNIVQYLHCWHSQGDWVHSQQICWWHRGEWCGWLMRGKGYHPEGPWQAWAGGPRQPWEVLQDQVQGPPPMSGQTPVSVQPWGWNESRPVVKDLVDVLVDENVDICCSPDMTAFKNCLVIVVKDHWRPVPASYNGYYSVYLFKKLSNSRNNRI